MAKRSVRLTLIARADCHLCETAANTISDVLSKVREAGIEVLFEELDLLSDQALIKQYQDDIPVVLVNGKRHSFWHVDEQKLTAAIMKQAKRRLF